MNFAKKFCGISLFGGTFLTSQKLYITSKYCSLVRTGVFYGRLEPIYFGTLNDWLDKWIFLLS